MQLVNAGYAHPVSRQGCSPPPSPAEAGCPSPACRVCKGSRYGFGVHVRRWKHALTLSHRCHTGTVLHSDAPAGREAEHRVPQVVFPSEAACRIEQEAWRLCQGSQQAENASPHSQDEVTMDATMRRRSMCTGAANPHMPLHSSDRLHSRIHTGTSLCNFKISCRTPPLHETPHSQAQDEVTCLHKRCWTGHLQVRVRDAQQPSNLNSTQHGLNLEFGDICMFPWSCRVARIAAPVPCLLADGPEVVERVVSLPQWQHALRSHQQIDPGTPAEATSCMHCDAAALVRLCIAGLHCIAPAGGGAEPARVHRM